MTGAARPHWRPLLVAGAALVCAWLVLVPGVALYDGVGFPDEPYRYVTRPAGDQRVTKPPTSAVARRPVIDGKVDGFSVASAEQGPQVTVFVPTGVLFGPKTASTIVVRADPRAPDSPGDGGKIDGNVYRVTATTDAGPASLAKAQYGVELLLRATTARQPGPIMEFRAFGRRVWQRLPTVRSGTDIYAAPARGFGDYALVFVAGAAQSPGAATPVATRPASSGRGFGFGLIVGGLVLVLAVVIVMIRIGRTRRGT